MKSRARLRKDSATHQLECAQRILSILFEKTGLSTILREAPTVTVGAGNWISFTAHQSVSSDVVFDLAASSGKPAFIPDLFNRRGKARSKTSPSLHLTNLDSDEILRGLVDAHYWAKHPLAHADEFLRKKTALPSDLLKRLQDWSSISGNVRHRRPRFLVCAETLRFRAGRKKLGKFCREFAFPLSLNRIRDDARNSMTN